VDALLQKKQNVLCLYPQYLADVYAHILWIGRLCEVAREAETLVSEIKSALAALAAVGKDMEVQRVYVEIWPDPTMNAAPWVAELVDMLGGRSVPEPPGRRVTTQDVLASDPQVILLAWAGVEAIDSNQVLKRPGWEQVSAVQSGRIVVLDEIMVNAPGPNLVQGAQEIWSALYPERPMPVVG